MTEELLDPKYACQNHSSYDRFQYIYLVAYCRPLLRSSRYILNSMLKVDIIFISSIFFFSLSVNDIITYTHSNYKVELYLAIIWV